MTDIHTAEQNAERFPIGPQPQLGTLTPGQRQELLSALDALPTQFRAAFAGLSAEQLDTPYREGGWSQSEQRRGDDAPSREGPKLMLINFQN